MNNKKRPLNFIIPTIAIVGISSLFIYAIFYSTSKSGFGLEDKTLMDWVELLIIPVTLAVAAYFLNNFDKERENKRATDQKREDALQHYFDKVTDIIRSGKELSEEDLTAIKIRTFTVLRMLDSDRKGFIVKFLFETGLIATKAYIYKHEKSNSNETKPARLSLLGADLKNVNLENATLYFREQKDDHLIIWKIDLSGADLSWANLSGAVMNQATLSSTILKNANLSKLDAGGGYFSGTDFSFANLTDAQLANSSFYRALLIKTYCKGTSFCGSNFFDSLSESYGNTVERSADLSGAVLIYSDFTEANILPDQLKQAKRIWKTRLPSYVSYSGFHPLFSIYLSTSTGGKVFFREGAEVRDAFCGCKQILKVDLQKIINENAELAVQQGLFYTDEDIDILKALWSKYAFHLFDIYAKNSFTKFIYILTEYLPTGYIPKDNFVQIYRRSIIGGIRFWKTYKETNGFTYSQVNSEQYQETIK